MFPCFAHCEIGSSSINSLALKSDASKQDFYFRTKICIKKPEYNTKTQIQ